MAKTLTINTTDIVGSYLEYTKFEEFPKYEEPIDFANYNEPLDLPKYEEPVEFSKYEEPLEFSAVDESITIMADISDTPRSPSSPTNKHLDQIIRTPGRKPSPQPTHFSVPPKNGNGNGHRVLRSATVGYIAPEFKGKAAQMLQGKDIHQKIEFLL
jgi:glutamate dehydrogenase